MRPRRRSGRPSWTAAESRSSLHRRARRSDAIVPPGPSRPGMSTETSQGKAWDLARLPSAVGA
eukprot:12875218-Alexandrium_andersonii.AAC.1